MTDDKTVQVEWALVCDHALVDAGGKLSLIGIFDRLFAVTVPAMHPVMYFVAQWVGPAMGTIEAEVRIWGPSKELIGSAQQHVELGPVGRSAGILQLSPLPLPALGEYVFELLAGGVSQRHVTVVVEQPGP